MNIEILRKRNNLKQFYICECLKIKKNTFSQWESGKRQPSIEIIPKLAKILNCSIEELVLAIIETKRGCKNGKVHS